MTVLVQPCRHDAAKYAVTNWHYSRCMPRGRLVTFGAWEADRFIGAVIFARGATPQLLNPYGLTQSEGCELVRVALTRHDAPVTEIVAKAIRLLKATNPGLRLIVSFSDTAQGHHGGIYQAGNWIYTGQSMHHRIRLHGELIHPRTLGTRYGIGGQSIPWLRTHVDPAAERVDVPGKHRYLYPLDRGMRRQVAPLALAYPARVESCDGSVHGDTPPDLGGEVGSSPTRRSHRELVAS